jgi:hypothetical protein
MTVGSKVKQTLANLQGCENTLNIYLIEERDKEIKKIYEDAVLATGKIINSLERRIKTIEFEEPQYKGN